MYNRHKRKDLAYGDYTSISIRKQDITLLEHATVCRGASQIVTMFNRPGKLFLLFLVYNLFWRGLAHIFSIQENIMSKSDFWWLNSNERSRYQYTEFGHHRPICDDEDPSSVNWDTNTYSINELEHWRDRFQNTNVYRALRIASDSLGEEEIIGPFLVDIDNSDEDLGDALIVTRKTFCLLRDEFSVDINNLRIFFTGHKGFNLEIRPQDLGIRGSTNDQIRKSADVLHQITEVLRRGKSWQVTNCVSDTGTVIDQIYGDRFCYTLKHPHIRLHGSQNMWISSDGKTKTRMKIELTFDELNKLPVTEIAGRAEELAT